MISLEVECDEQVFLLFKEVKGNSATKGKPRANLKRRMKENL